MLLLLPSTKVLGYFRDVRSADAKAAVAMPASQDNDRKPSDLKVLAEGFHSTITSAFVAVVRDSETYAKLTKMDGNLPKLSAEFFETHIAIAAFLGERNTGGYRVEMTRESSGQIHLAEVKPGKGVMVPQMITAPFKMVTLEISPTSRVPLSLDNAWRKLTRSYRVTNGKFTMSGGFAGTTEEFALEGELRIMRESDLATFVFEVVGTGPAKKHSLDESATGVVQSDGHVTINKMSAGSLVDPPNSGLKVTGSFSDGDKKLLLNLVSLPQMIADGYSGIGKIQAEILLFQSKP